MYRDLESISQGAMKIFAIVDLDSLHDNPHSEAYFHFVDVTLELPKTYPFLIADTLDLPLPEAQWCLDSISQME
jgi:hypothetical protein